MNSTASANHRGNPKSASRPSSRLTSPPTIGSSVNGFAAKPWLIIAVLRVFGIVIVIERNPFTGDLFCLRRHVVCAYLRQWRRTVHGSLGQRKWCVGQLIGDHRRSPGHDVGDI